MYFQKTGTPESGLKSSKIDAQVESHQSSSVKSYLKVMPFCLWENNFAGLVTALISQKYKFLSFIYPTHLNPKFSDKVDINKINLHTGKIGTGKKDECKQGLKLISSNSCYRRTPDFEAIPRVKGSKQKLQSHGQQFCPLLSFSPLTGPTQFLPDCRTIL